jgi:hypothetical protein
MSRVALSGDSEKSPVELQVYMGKHCKDQSMNICFVLNPANRP